MAKGEGGLRERERNSGWRRGGREDGRWGSWGRRAGDGAHEGFGEEQCDGGKGEISPEMELVEESGRGA